MLPHVKAVPSWFDVTAYSMAPHSPIYISVELISSASANEIESMLEWAIYFLTGESLSTPPNVMSLKVSELHFSIVAVKVVVLGGGVDPSS